MMKKKIIIFVLTLVCCMLCGCSAREYNNSEDKIILYQVKEDKSGLKETDYIPKAEKDDTVGYVTELLKNYTPVEIQDFQIKEKQISIFFTSSYRDLKGIEEVLFRASIVKTLCQVSGIEYVEFFIDNDTLVEDGEQVGVMSRLSFMDSIGGDGYTQEKYVTLYFSNTAGTQLKEITTKITHDMTVPLARLLVEQLIAGPEEIMDVNTSDVRQTVPDKAMLNSLTIRDNVCYVDFSSDIENIEAGVKSELVVYSVVNTLCELADVNKVQFTIDGEQQETYGDTKGFNNAYERNLDIVSNGSKG